MKCDKYTQLLEKYDNNMLSADEKEDLFLHIKNCGSCKQKFETIEKYKLLMANLQQHKPILKEKEIFIDQILKQLPIKETNISTTNKKNIKFLPYNIRLVITSMAASLVLLFALQQTFDAWKIKQLENKFAYQQKTIDYPLLKATIIINLLNEKDNYNFTGILSKAKKILRNQTFAMFRNNHSLLTKSEIKKMSNPDFVLYVDSTNHP
jgi:hypothetical protein